MKKVILLLLLSLVVFAIHSGQEKGPEGFAGENSLELAHTFVENSPTHKFDGSGLVHVRTLQARCPGCWVFSFDFESRHAGHGDRTNQMVAQVITPHRAVISVEGGSVVGAILDDQWDMINQKSTLPPAKCGLEDCHGMEPICGPNPAEVCTEMYQLGDRCRRFVKCEIIDGRCTLVETDEFLSCKACVEDCLENFSDDGPKVFECESEC